jgi:serpin B
MRAAAVVDSLERYGWPTPSPRTEQRDVSLALPRFRVEQRTNLVPPLRAIGMGIMFDSARADFGGLLTPSPHRPPPCPPISQGTTGGYCTRVRIDEATQDAFIDVNEEGTEAAAVTVLSFGIVVLSAGPPPIPFVVDRPFFFAIRDERTGTLLFTGYVADPKR